MMKTIGIVVGCAIAYLGLIVGLTVFCSLQMLRTRRKRSRKAPRSQENGQLLLPVSEASIRGTTIGNRNHQGKNGTGHTYHGGSTNPLLDASNNLTRVNADESNSLSFGPAHMYPQQQNARGSTRLVAPQSTVGAGASLYTPTSSLCNGNRGPLQHPLQHPYHQQQHMLMSGNGRHQTPHTTGGVPVNSSATFSPSSSNRDPSWWLPISNHSNNGGNPCDNRIPVSPAGTMEMFPELNSFDQTSCTNLDGNHSSLVDDLLSGANHGQCLNRHYHHHHHGHYPSYGNGLHYSRAAGTLNGVGVDELGVGSHGNSGVGSATVVTTAASDTHMAAVSAPPPTPLDSRSHLSGMSSGGNSTSLYSRSLLSGASNLGSGMLPTTTTTSPTGGGGDLIPKHAGGGVGRSVISQTDRMSFPRSELKVEGMLGKGEFGDVFVARPYGGTADEHHPPVLVKSLTSHNPMHVNEFHRQLELFGKTDSSYVTRLLGVCMEKEPFYMLMEYCEWGDLKMYLRRAREDNPINFKLPALTSGQKLMICRQLAFGMDYLAQLHCVHRDLAARNVFITPCRMEVKIGSPGLARDTYASDYHHLGTDQPIPLRWLSPELILAFSHRHSSLPYSSGSDVWAFATLLWEVYTLADLPLSWLTDQDIIGIASRVVVEAASAGGPADTQRLRPDVLPSDMPTEVSQLVSRAWSHPAQHRPEFSEINLVLNAGDRHI